MVQEYERHLAKENCERAESNEKYLNLRIIQLERENRELQEALANAVNLVIAAKRR